MGEGVEEEGLFDERLLAADSGIHGIHPHLKDRTDAAVVF